MTRSRADGPCLTQYIDVPFPSASGRPVPSRRCAARGSILGSPKLEVPRLRRMIPELMIRLALEAETKETERAASLLILTESGLRSPELWTRSPCGHPVGQRRKA